MSGSSDRRFAGCVEQLFDPRAAARFRRNQPGVHALAPYLMASREKRLDNVGVSCRAGQSESGEAVDDLASCTRARQAEGSGCMAIDDSDLRGCYLSH